MLTFCVHPATGVGSLGMPRVRPTEKRLVRSMLEKEEWEDEDECAAAIITALDEMRERDREYYCLAVQHETDSGNVTLMYGPFITAKEAERAYLRGTGQVSDTDKIAVFKMTTPYQAALAQDI